MFLNFCEAYGLTKTGLFQTVDLYEGRNMAQVLNCIQQLGTEVSDVIRFHSGHSRIFQNEAATSNKFCVVSEQT